MTDSTQSDIAVGRVWKGLTGIRYRVVEVTDQGRVQLSSITPGLEAGLDALPEDLRATFTLEDR